MTELQQETFTNQFAEALIEAKSAIEIGMTLDAMDVCLEDAISNLSAITGESVNEIVLEEVFSKFCVGK